MTGTLGRLVPTDWNHVDKYPLSALSEAVVPTGIPVVIGINWYTAFDNPIKVGSQWWIGKDGNLGSIRGGHCVCLKTSKLEDPLSWWAWYNQVSEGMCVGEGVTRLMSLLNRKRYQPRPLYDEAQKIDEWPGEDYEGTSVRAGLDVVRTLGMVPAKSGEQQFLHKGEVTRPFIASEGIVSNRWATSVDEVRTVLNSPKHDQLQAVPIINSWGKSYPRIVWLPYKILERLIHEDGEVGLVVDR